MSRQVCNDVPPPVPRPYCLHPKDTLPAFMAIRHTMTVVSILMTAFAALIVARAKSVARSYSAMLVFLLFLWMSMDVLIQWVFDPVLLFPLMCGYRRAPLLNVPMSAGAAFGIEQSIIMLGLVTYVGMFLYRHQVIVPVGSLFKLPIKFQVIFLTVLLLPYLALGAQFYSECISATSKGHSTMAWHIFRLLRNLTHISMKTQTLHRVLVRSLIIQAHTPVAFIILPVSVATCIHIVFINQYPAVMSGWGTLFLFCQVVLSFHATAHSMALIATTPAFRTKLAFRRRAATPVLHVLDGFTSKNGE